MRFKLYCLLLPFLALPLVGQSQSTDCKAAALAFQEKLNKEFRTEGESPLTAEDRATFKKLHFFKFNPALCVQASFTPTPDEAQFDMPTSSTKVKKFIKVGVLSFDYKGQPLQISVYKNLNLPPGHPEYENLLFIPFKDLTSGESTYGGGRYIDIEGPLSETVTLDFNQCYNPYCAYSTGWSCPIPPAENNLPIAVKAGVKAWKH